MRTSERNEEIAKDKIHRGFCVFLDTICQGAVPVEHDGCGGPIVYGSREEAQRSIIEDIQEKLTLCREGSLCFEEAIAVDEYVQAVNIEADGTVVLAPGRGPAKDR
jgi:hypothetical protein